MRSWRKIALLAVIAYGVACLATGLFAKLLYNHYLIHVTWGEDKSLGERWGLDVNSTALALPRFDAASRIALSNGWTETGPCGGVIVPPVPWLDAMWTMRHAWHAGSEPITRAHFDAAYPESGGVRLDASPDGRPYAGARCTNTSGGSHCVIWSKGSRIPATRGYFVGSDGAKILNSDFEVGPDIARQ